MSINMTPKNCRLFEHTCVPAWCWLCFSLLFCFLFFSPVPGYPVRRKYPQAASERLTIDTMMEELCDDHKEDSFSEQQEEVSRSSKRLLPDRTHAAHNRANEKLVHFIVKQRMVEGRLLVWPMESITSTLQLDAIQCSVCNTVVQLFELIVALNLFHVHKWFEKHLILFFTLEIKCLRSDDAAFIVGDYNITRPASNSHKKCFSMLFFFLPPALPHLSEQIKFFTWGKG